MSLYFMKQLMLSALLASVLVALSATGLLTATGAPRADREFPALGVGGMPCSRFSSDLRTGSVERERYKSWIVGFATGYNYFRTVPKNKGLFSGHDAEGIVRTIDRECSSKPNERVADVTYDFIRGLMMQAPNQK